MDEDILRFSSGFTQNSYFAIAKNSIIEIYKSLSPFSSEKGLNFTYVDDLKIDASAFVNAAGQDCIEINVGTVLSAFTFMKTALSMPNIFCEIGNSRGEKGNVIRGGFNKDNPTNRFLYFDGTPQDEERELVSTQLALMMLRFVSMHELGHLYNGHISLLNQVTRTNKSSMVMNLVNKDSSANLSALDIRTLEMDADAYAATAGIINAIGLYSSDFDLLGTLKDKKDIFKMLTFSFCSLFLVFEDMLKIEYSDDSLYLPNEARALLAYGAVTGCMDAMRKNSKFEVSDNDYSEINKKLVEGITEAQKFFFMISGKDYNFVSSFASNPDHMAYADRVLRHWDNELRFRLENHTRMVLYNPEGMDEFWNDLKWPY